MQAGSGFDGMRQALSEALATPNLRRLQLSWAASAVGGWIFFVTLAVYAYDAGGAAAVGIAALVRMVPAGLAAPVAGLLADRHPRRDVMLGAIVVRAILLTALAAGVSAGVPIGVVLVGAALFTVVTTAHKPAQAALLPHLAQTPRQLGASNAVWSGIDNAAFLVGSLLAGALIANAGTTTAFFVTAGVFAFAALPLARIPRDPVPDYRLAGTGERAPIKDLAGGFQEVWRDGRLRLVVGFLSLTTLIEGMADVLVVVVAIQLLDLGGAGVGWLNGSWGLGGLIGGAVALSLLRRGRLATGLAAGGLLVAVPLMGLAAVNVADGAGLLLILLGVGYALIEVAGLSLLQRLTSDDVLARAFAVVESSYWITTGLGAILAPAVVTLLGPRGALVAVGATLALAVLLRWRALLRFEGEAPVPEETFKVLRGVSVFAPLPIATVENVSRRMAELRYHPGQVVIAEGDEGDRFYVVAEGVLDVTCERGSFAPVASGDFFGEIALLRDVPRTATVTAREETVLYALDRDSFLCAVGAHRCAGTVARRRAESRLNKVPVG
jgi:MFS family permease